ncbi:MAG: type IV pilus assembly protein PilA [Myxococcota bacterium]|jgi:type IV pilus assembly protein PilA
MTNRKGFTLVELMIVVAIIGILAAIAIPNFVSMQYRAKRAEIPANVDGIKTAELAYDAAFDTFVVQATLYPGAPGKAQVAWASGSGFDTIGWSPDGKVRGSYKVTTSSSTNFVITGVSDVDGDGTQATYTSTKSLNAAFSGANNNIY